MTINALTLSNEQRLKSDPRQHLYRFHLSVTCDKGPRYGLPYSHLAYLTNVEIISCNRELIICPLSLVIIIDVIIIDLYPTLLITVLKIETSNFVNKLTHRCMINFILSTVLSSSYFCSFPQIHTTLD